MGCVHVGLKHWYPSCPRKKSRPTIANTTVQTRVSAIHVCMHAAQRICSVLLTDEEEEERGNVLERGD